MGINSSVHGCHDGKVKTVKEARNRSAKLSTVFGLLISPGFSCCGSKRKNPRGKRQISYTIPLNILGFQVSGDIGGLTIYTDRFGKKVAFPKSPPKEPASDRQLQQRLRFREAQQEWKALANQVKKNLEDMCRKANVPMTGQNIWIHTAMRHDFTAYQTLQNQTGITVPEPNPV